MHPDHAGQDENEVAEACPLLLGGHRSPEHHTKAMESFYLTTGLVPRHLRYRWASHEAASHEAASGVNITLHCMLKGASCTSDTSFWYILVCLYTSI